MSERLTADRPELEGALSPRQFSNESVTLHHGESVEILGRCVPNASVDLIFIDPPYNIGKIFGNFRDCWKTDVDYAQWCYDWLALCLQKLKPQGSMYVMASTQAMPYLDLWLRQRCTILSRIVWTYDSSGMQARKHYGSLYEPILFCVKDARRYTFNADAIEVEARTGAVRKLIDYRKADPKPYNTKKVPGNSWHFARVRYRMSEYENHPSQKPEALMERIILASTRPGDLVLDPFAGTFTTCAVAQRLGRRSIGIELQEEYVRIGLRRLRLEEFYNGEPLRAPAKSFARRKKAEKAPPIEAQIFRGAD